MSNSVPRAVAHSVIRQHLCLPVWNSARRLLAVSLAATLVSVGLLNGTIARAAAGGFDPTFGSNGKVTANLGMSVHATALQTDGKIVVGGSAGSQIPPWYPSDFAVGRFNSDGTPDDGSAHDSTPHDSFGSGGKTTTDILGSSDEVAAIAIQPDGKIVAVGYTRDHAPELSAVFALARYNTDGQLDTGFGQGGKVIGDFTSHYSIGATAVVLQPDGKIVAAGVSKIQEYALARYNTDGSLDDGTANDSTPGDSFGSGGKVLTDVGTRYASGMALQPDGKLVVTGGGGEFHESGLLARYNSDGQLDTDFGDGGLVVLDDMSAGAVALQRDGKIVLAGAIGLASTHSSFGLARYESNGQPDSKFGQGGQVKTDFLHQDGGAGGVVIQTDGKIVACGSISANGGSDRRAVLARYNRNGRLDTSFGQAGKLIPNFGQGSSGAADPLLQPDGKIVIFGTGYTLARLLNDASSISPPLASLTINPPLVSECGRIRGTVTLEGPAPPGGVYVALSTTNEAASLPTQIRIPAGETTRAFNISVTPGASAQTGSIIARLGTTTKIAQLIVRPIGVSSVTLNPNPVEEARPVTGVVTLGCAAPEGGLVVTLTSNNPAFASPVQSSITIPAGARVKSFVLRVSDAASGRRAVITATANGLGKSVVLTAH